MRLVMTVMVRDEADIIGPMIDHHLAQGVDHFVITDNGSIDGTTEILERYAASGVVDLRHDPEHRKQQGVTVTRMARDAYTVHGATWVVNADADEFWVPVNRDIRLRDAFAGIPTDVGAFEVPVVDMTGSASFEGSGLNRLYYRDTRPVEMLRKIGLHAHSTSDAVHVGTADVEVVQGNHFVSVASQASPPPESAIEVLHLPWRSWSQFRRKVENAGLAYENNSGLTPSPNHHGMRDWRRLRAGTLFGFYLARHPSPDELHRGLKAGYFVEDRTLVGRPDPVRDKEIPVDHALRVSPLATTIVARESRIAALEYELAEHAAMIAGLREEIRVAQEKKDELVELFSMTKNRRIVRFTDRLADLAHARALRRPSDTQV